jgi:leucyl/phenylalanyl-tRNA--protein transferase
VLPVLLDEIEPQFPSTQLALEDPNGLLAVGGNLSEATLLDAYSKGIFPWFTENDPLLWWSPSPRMALRPADAHFGRSLIKLAKKRPFTVTVNRAFSQVIQACAQIPREGQDGTWITTDMIAAYQHLHRRGYAHSIECWHDRQLVGGLYGIAIGRVFFGESMFSRMSGASKIAFASLCVQLNKWGFELIDCQVYTEHLASFGAEELERDEFERRIASAVSRSEKFDWLEQWQLGDHGFDGFK